MNYYQEKEKRQVIQENLMVLVERANEILDNPDAPLPEEMTIPYKSRGYTSTLTLKISPMNFQIIEGGTEDEN